MELINKIDEEFIFDNKSVRVITKCTQPWFVAKDICNILNIKDNRSALRIIPEKWKEEQRMPTLGGLQEMTIISEPALYKIIMRSNKDIANKFQEWICEEVLPSIRKTGEFKLINMLKDKEKEVKEKDEEIKSLHKLVKRKERKKFNKNNSVYIISNPDIKNYLKIGKSHDLNKRLDSLASGAPSQYEVEHCRFVKDAYEETAIELLLLSILDEYRVKNDTKGCKSREWITNISLDIVKNELDMLVDYIEERKTFHLELEEKQCTKLLFLYENGDEIEDIIENEDVGDVEDEEYDIEVKTKKCYICNIEKSLEEYFNRKENIDKKEGTCKECYYKNKKRLKEEKNIREIIIREEGTKKCRICNIIKEYSHFYKHASSQDGYEYTCTECKVQKHDEVSEKMCMKCRKTKGINDFNKFRLGYNKYCKLCQPIELLDENLKKCSSCKEDFSLDNFSKAKRSSDGLYNYCKKCGIEKNKQKYKIKDKIKISEKICIICNTNKPIENYYKCITEKDGHKSRCKNCVKENDKNNRVSLTT